MNAFDSAAEADLRLSRIRRNVAPRTGHADRDGRTDGRVRAAAKAVPLARLWGEPIVTTGGSWSRNDLYAEVSTSAA